MRRIIVVLTVAAVVVAMIATAGVPASAQSSCPPTGPSDGTATIVIPDEPFGAGFICLDEEALEFFCPSEFELQLFPNPEPSPAFIAECVELVPPSDTGGTGDDDSGADLTQEGEQ